MNKTLIHIILGIAILGGLFFFIKPDSPATNDVNRVTLAKVFELVIKDSKIISGSTKIQVNQGDLVTIKITADENNELHIHGYDKSLEFMKDQLAEITFSVDVAGSFPFELHEGTKAGLGELVVSPK